MFLMNMTSEELAAEYKADLPEIEADNKRFDNSAFVSKMLRRYKKYDAVGCERFFKSKRNNRYLNVFTYIKKDNSTSKNVNWEWCVYTIGLIETSKGVCAVIFYDNARIGVVYQAHFFNRYKERFIKDCDWVVRKKLELAHSVTDIIPIYIRRNFSVAWMNTKSKFGDKQHIFAPVSDGVILLQWDGKKLQANTFITEGMYSNEQQDMVDYAKQYKQYREATGDLAKLMITLMNEDNNDKSQFYINSNHFNF